MSGIAYGIKQKLDASDKKILRILFQDGRMSIADISEKTGLRRDSVARRLRRMRKEQIVTAFVPIINPPALGYPNIAIILLHIKTGNEENSRKWTSYYKIPFSVGFLSNKTVDLQIR